MLKNLKNLKGAKAISKKEQQLIIGATGTPFNNPTYFQCLRTCGGSCTGSGNCYEMEK
ncbi:hypothetical protein [uncultured Kordia sp.]|uniref:hypothetical protein n=1 Tax=uncultured Kordia sp. TaxID=507699 RepID=UPI00261A9D94|nr:hypothetical protein [uncultured Kordia sp.]